MSDLFKEPATSTTVSPADNTAGSKIADGYLLYSKKEKVQIVGDKISINGAEPELKEGIDPHEYAKIYARNIYERTLRECLLAENLIVLTGAGSSIASDEDQLGGLSMRQLWDFVSSADSGSMTRLVNLVHYDPTLKNLETLLTYAEQYINYNEKLKLDPKTQAGLDLEFVKNSNQAIKTIIVDKCNFADGREIVVKSSDIAVPPLPATVLSNAEQATETSVVAAEPKSFNEHTHTQFLKNISYRKNRLARPKIFTTNYDRAFEVAASAGVFILIDGFSFDSRRSFNGKFFDYDIVLTKNNRVPTEDNFAPNVIHLYKLHGSIDWFREGKKIVQKRGQKDELPLMIFPNRDKFQLSYDQPYFEMMSRFQTELRKSGSTTLLVIGFSFGDDHINRIIEESLRHNAFLKIVIVDKFLQPPFNQDWAPHAYLQRKAEDSDQVLFVSESFEDLVKNMPSPKDRSIDVFGELDEPRSKTED